MSRASARSSCGAVVLPHSKPFLTIAALLAFPLLCYTAVASGDARAAALGIALPVAANLALCTLFGVTLRRGREPLISRFARLVRGEELPAELRAYARRLTVAWTVFFALMACISLALALWASLAAWTFFTSVVNYLLVVLFFVGEYAYRRLRYHRYPHASPGQIVRRLRAYRPW